MVFSQPLRTLVSVLCLLSLVSAAPRVDPGIHRKLRRDGTVNIFATVAGATNIFESRKEAAFTSRGAMIEDLVQRLQKNADNTQSGILDLVMGGEVASLMESTETTTAVPATRLAERARSFWISNQLFFAGATPELIDMLMEMPDIVEITEEEIIPLPILRQGISNLTDSLAGSASAMLSSPEWGVAKIQAPDVWSAGFRGEGIVVGQIDTGVRGSHALLSGNYRGSYGWYDPMNKTTTPNDEVGHGTHAMGIMAGANGIGVAPGAQWMACRGCGPVACTGEAILACSEYLLCPYDSNGHTDCSKAPHVINNSYGGGQGRTQYKAAIEAWLRAGIIPVYSNGNAGENCGTAGSHADLGIVIGVGATDSNDVLAYYSSRGPAVTGILKPDVSAPGDEIRSASYESDTGYINFSGTSMAAPHVTGLVALLLQAKPGLSYNQVYEIITQAADRKLGATGQSCGGIADNVYPNNMYGYGRVNALRAVNSFTGCTKTWSEPVCNAKFFCTYNKRTSICQPWWF
ncbi:hypothetical protein Poli38472_001770 [Pythium oligandrum]|uniref:subtilisin n=1 Tax=Pythium oligandrum TaxID=41045 RepID=A0A8K1FQN6_PYTOL|nr:hypothetical protein Poli38472_001770 [Pythium oligandrum]|eukprot:TMW69614.1 hypothetical protein Poli38472_001770 [Pythium oligandrum]